MVLKVIGYWDGPAAPAGLPDVCGFVATDADPAVQRTVAAYLRSGTVLAVAAGMSRCRLCGIANGSAELTDGTHFVWPEGLAHYVEAHDVRLPEEVAAVAASGPAPAVDPAPLEAASLDLTWWCALGTPDPVVHRLGCRHSGRTAPWDLPTSADVYVDRVPDGAVATLGRIRTLLGAQWQISDLRRMLTTQPFLAVAGGNPAALHRALDGAAPLRPFLFHRTPGGLEPIWPDEV
ncbi:hypothetical protein GCM10010532_062850 [Dactylosporangium siamense]|uniref:Uncharacterized protein n=2 Tax=Dactylosporangium siamense TaxID=685454 RepID=A0A919UGQ0_9ACTN|nr:hypothetical protein Dsi01nite_088710 [Dactylosporangium siamense]